MLRTTVFSLLVVFVLLVFVDVPPAQAQDNKAFVVIVNEANSIGAASRSEISNWFIKKVTSWGNGLPIRPVDLVPTSPVREEFSSYVHGKKVSAIQSYWQKQIFSGSGTPPAEKKTEAEVLAYVKSNPGAVGYVSASSNTSGVRVLKISD